MWSRKPQEWGGHDPRWVTEPQEKKNNISKLTLFTDDTSIIFSNSESTDYAAEFIVPFDKTNIHFAINSLSLNLNEASYVHFTAKWNTKIDISINFEDIQINQIYNTEYLGLPIDNTLSWKKEIEQLTPRLSSVGYSFRSLKSIMSQKSLRAIYFSYVHSTMSHGIIFWGNFSYTSSIFKIQTRTIIIIIIIIIIMNAVSSDSCHPLFKKLNILLLYSQYIFSLSTFVVKNKDAFKSNFAIHSINTRHGFDLHPPTTNLTKAQKGVNYSGIIFFYNLPLNIRKLLHYTNHFKLALNKFFLAGSFYSCNEYFE